MERKFLSTCGSWKYVVDRPFLPAGTLSFMRVVLLANCSKQSVLS